jgi:hypothetical protein
MRFMVMIKANEKSEAGKLPSAELIAAMGRFNEEMARAGVMLAGEGLQASSKGARVHFTKDGARKVIDGPFSETKELVAGFWIIQTKSREEAIEWIKRCPCEPGEEGSVEIRQVFEAEDFPTDVFTPEERAREEKLRTELEKRAAKK